MKTITKFFAATLLLLSLAISAFAYDFSAVCSSGQTLYYNITSSSSPYEVEVTYQTFPYNYDTNEFSSSYSSLYGSLTIPSTVTYFGSSYSVTSIGNYAFLYCSGLTEVTFPNSVTNIGGSAFLGCSGLTSLTIPNSVTSIGVCAFVGCIGLETIAVESGNTTYDSQNNCNAIIETATNKLIAGCKNTIIPNSVTSIGEYAFNSCIVLTSLTIPNSVTSIGSYAFSGCSRLTSVTIPNSVTSIGDNAFSGVINIVYSGTATGSPWGALNVNGYVDGYLVYSDNTKTNIMGCSIWATTVTIPNSVTSIGNSAFSGCSRLTSVYYTGDIEQWCGITFADNVSNPLYYAHNLYVNNNLVTDLVVPNTMEEIKGYVFYGATCLTSVTIPNSVTSIGWSAFESCSGLTSVYYTGDIEQWCGITFGNESSNPLCYAHNLYIDDALVTDLVIPNTITGIKNYAFYRATCLTSVTIPNSVTNIGASAFYACTGLTSVTIHESVTNIGDAAFYGCSGLTTVNYNATNCTTMGSSSNPVFVGCTSLATLNIGENVRKIPNFAFKGCSGLTSINIPNTVIQIGGGAFSGCSGLVEMTIPFVGGFATATSAYSSTLFGYIFGSSGYTDGTFVEQHYGSGTYDKVTYCIPNSLRSVTVTGGNLLYGAFYGCSMITSVTIGNSVTSIGDGAFSGCSGLVEMTIPFVGGNVAATEASASTLFGYIFGTTSYEGGTAVRQYYSGSESMPVSYTTYYIPRNLRSITVTGGNMLYGAFIGCSMLTSVTIQNSVTSIGDWAFHNCSGLTGTLTIPNSTTNIGSSAFKNCNGLTSLVIGNSVASIGNSAFYGCSGLTGTLTIPNSTTNIGSSAFKNCNGLTSLVTGESLASIGASAFEGCSAIRTMTLGSNVATIGNRAFAGCTGLFMATVKPELPPMAQAETFENVSTTAVIKVPCGSVPYYNAAQYWNVFTNVQGDMVYTLSVGSSDDIMGYATVTQAPTCTNPTGIITATANNRYRFVSWNDGNTANPRTVTLTSDAHYIANFESLYPTVYNSFTAEACGSYSWNDQTYTASGEYQQTFTAISSADSIVTLNLTIYPMPQPEITASGVLDGCNPSPITLSAGDYSTYNWSTGATTATISISEPGYYYVEVIDAHGCTGISEQINIGYSNALTVAPQISVVGMNSENHNVVAWSALDNENVNAYRIYRENNVANVYEPMATVEASQTTWTDETADPTARAYRYKVTAVDECGGESPMSDYHKTMHLTINQGIGNTWNLIWSHYEGFDFGTYRIYRGTNPSNMTMIGEVPSNLNSYTDNTATDNTGFYYQVEVVRNSRSRDAEISSRSNIVDNGIFPEYTITVMSANPNRGTVTGGGTYPEGTVITIEAIANEGFEFASWSDENTDNPRQITVTADATYIATFDEVSSVTEYTITVMSANPNRGTVTGGGTYAEGTVITIEAIANEGFEFASWSDENTDNPRQITVTADATYIATFIPATNIEENVALEITLFPNPANDILNITSSETISEIEIVNTLGQVVKRIEVNADNAVCDVEDLKAGVYVVRIRTTSATLSQRKFIKE